MSRHLPLYFINQIPQNPDFPFLCPHVKLHVRHTSVMHTMLGFVISFLLVFRTNTAYERWWEGRKLWGALVDNSRNLAMKIASMLPLDHKQRVFLRDSHRYIHLLRASQPRIHCRGN